MSTGLPRPGLARSAHRGRIKFLRGYVSKSSAAVNPLTITQLACEVARTVCVARPSPSISGAHAYNCYIAPRVCTLVPFINPRRACAARVTVVVLCACLSVYYYSRTTGYEAAYERYQQIQCYKGRKNNVAILLKRLRSRDMA